jgi:SET domain-containing protein
MKSSRRRPFLAIRTSPTHGRGAFATRVIRKGTRIIEYRGALSTWDLVQERPASHPTDPYHTLLFVLEDGMLIDAGRGGNAARWINHSCDPNCEAVAHEDQRVFIYAKRTIYPGEELCYDYCLTLDDPITPRMRKAYRCRCGAKSCRGTMLYEEKPARTPAKARKAR